MHAPFIRSLTYVLLLFLQFSAYSQINREHIKTAENGYSADLGNDTYLNPVLKANYANPYVVRHGEDYYLTHSSFDNIPWTDGLALKGSGRLDADRQCVNRICETFVGAGYH